MGIKCVKKSCSFPTFPEVPAHNSRVLDPTQETKGLAEKWPRKTRTKTVGSKTTPTTTFPTSPKRHRNRPKPLLRLKPTKKAKRAKANGTKTIVMKIFLISPNLRKKLSPVRQLNLKGRKVRIKAKTRAKPLSKTSPLTKTSWPKWPKRWRPKVSLIVSLRWSPHRL